MDISEFGVFKVQPTTQQLECVPRTEARTEFRRYVLFQAFLTLAVLIVFLGGVEVAARIRQYHRFGPKSLHAMALRDQFTGYRLNPAYGRVDRQHDAQGFRRDRDVALEKPPNTVRIFLAGASISYGYTTTMPEYTNNSWRFLYNDQTIDYYLEQKLNQAFPSKHWEVINAAVPNFQLSQELAQVESVLLRYHPDCIIMDGNNDIDPELWRHAKEHYDPYATVEGTDEFKLLTSPGSLRSFSFFLGEWLRTNSAAFRLVQERLRAVELQRQSGNQGTRHVHNAVMFSDLTPMEQTRFATAQSQLGFYTHTVRQIQRILDLDGVKAVFLLDPEVEVTHKPLTDSEQRFLNSELKLPGYTYWIQKSFPEIAAQMRALARQDGFTFLDLTDAFDNSSEQTFSDNVHLTPAGNRIIAERLFQALKETLAGKTVATHGS
jgi:hypothetical protein